MRTMACLGLAILSAFACARPDSGDAPPADESMSADSTDTPRLLRGAYTYMADAGIFTVCETGQRLPVAMEADNAALESAYARDRTVAAEPMLVVVEGHVAMRPRMDGGGEQETIIVDRFVRTSPGGSCEADPSTATLQETYWKLITVNGARVEVADSAREPHIILHTADLRASGSGGCNRLSGPFTLAGEQLAFGAIMMTKMACTEGMAVEQAFTAALGATRSYRIDGQVLELLGETGSTLARLRAVYLR